MIAFGCSITMPEIYDRHAGPGIRLSAEADSEVFAHAAAGPVARSYNLMLEKAAVLDDLEALVLVHQDAEIVDRDFCAKLRRALEDPDVGLVGCVGATGVHSIAWWEGSVTWDAFIRCYAAVPADKMPALSWNGLELPPGAPAGEVDALDGFMLALSPWAVRNLRFDESLSVAHGFDFDFCLQVRAAGRKVVVADLNVLHHHPLELVTDPETWIEAHMMVAQKWDGSMPDAASGPTQDWKQRARRAEAEAGAAQLAGASKLLQAYARAEEDENRLERVTHTMSWRLTEPLRRMNARRHARRRNRVSG
jgi:hypothetical protein